MTSLKRVYIGLGSNLANPTEQLQNAFSALAALPGSSLLAASSLYTSKPLGPADQPDYCNAVAALDTTLEPLQLLDCLQQIEQLQGRQRKAERWGPRTLDLDILLFADQLIDLPRLQVPHYHLQERPFVLYPLAEIAPELELPDGRSLAELLQNCPLQGLQRLPDSRLDGNAVTDR